MADFEKKVSLIEIEVDNEAAKAKVDELSSSILAQKNAVKENNTEIKNLNKTNKDLEKAATAGTISQKKANEQIAENSRRAFELQKTNLKLGDGIKDLNKERGNAVKATQLQSNSLDALRKKVISQKTELNGLNTATVAGRKRFDELTTALKDNNEKIKELDQGAGDYKTTIGDYKGEVGKALKETGLFGGVIGKLSQVQATAAAVTTGFKNATIGSTAATSGASKALKILKVALISTGIGAIVVVLGSLIAAFLSTQEGIDKVTSVTQPFFSVLNKLKGLVQELASGAFAGLAQILNGDIKEGLATIKGAFTDAVGGVGDAVKEGIKVGTELDKLQKSIERTEISLITNRARLNNEFEKQKSIAEDVTQSEEARITAAKAAQAAQEELVTEEQKLIDLKIKRKELENSQNDTSRADEKELAELIAQRTEFEAAATGKRVSVRNLENSIVQGIANEEKARVAEYVKGQEAKAKAAEAAAAIELAQTQKLADEKEKNEALLNTKLLALAEFRRSKENEKRLQGIEDTKEYYALKGELQSENFQTEREKLMEQSMITLEDEALTAEEKSIQQAEIDLALEELKEGHAERMIEIELQQKDEELAIQKEKEDKRLAIFRAGQEAIQGGINIANNIIDNFYNKRYANIEEQLKNGNITEEQYAKKKEQIDKNKAKSVYKAQVAEFRIKKAINIAGIIADTAKSIAAAVAATPLTGGLPFSAINAGLGAIQLATVISEKAPPPPSFAKGGDVFGMMAGGNLHSAGGTKYQGEDGNRFEVEKDEGIFVTKRSATNPALQMLSEANMMNGGRSMFSGSSRFLQDGGEASRATDSASMARMIKDAILSAPIPILPVQSIIGGINAETKAKKVGVI
jgi:hypothetical protein